MWNVIYRHQGTGKIVGKPESYRSHEKAIEVVRATNMANPDYTWNAIIADLERADDPAGDSRTS